MINVGIISDHDLIKTKINSLVNCKKFPNVEAFIKNKEKFDIIIFESKKNSDFFKVYHEVLDINSNAVFIVIFHKFNFEKIKRGFREGIYDFIPLEDFEKDIELTIQRAIEHAKILKSKEKVYEFTKHYIYINIPSDINLINETVIQILSTAKSAGFITNKESENNLRLALTEGIVNAIVHGNKSDKNKKVNIKVFINHKFFKIKIKDMGEGFDFENSIEEINENDLLKSHGRGVYLMKITMDEVKYIKNKKELVMIKYKKDG